MRRASLGLLFGALIGCGSSEPSGQPTAPMTGTGGAATSGGSGGGGATSAAGAGGMTSVGAADPDVVHQAPAWDVVPSGPWSGTIPFARVREWGDFGVGSSDGFAGEVVADGEVFLVEADGVPRVPNDSELAVYIVMTRFAVDSTHPVAAQATCLELMNEVLPPLVDLNEMVAIRIRGQFETTTTRSFVGWAPPFPDPSIALSTGQVQFFAQNVAGAIVGYYLPERADGFCSLGSRCVQKGFHFHFISDDRQVGGHLNECDLTSGTIELDVLNELRVHAPDGSYESLFAGG